MPDITLYPMDSTDRDAIVELLRLSGASVVESDGVIEATVGHDVLNAVAATEFAYDVRADASPTLGPREIYERAEATDAATADESWGPPEAEDGVPDETEKAGDNELAHDESDDEEQLAEAPAAVGHGLDELSAGDTWTIVPELAFVAVEPLGLRGLLRVTTAAAEDANRLAKALQAVGGAVRRVEGRWLVVDVDTEEVAETLEFSADVQATHRYDPVVAANAGAAAAVGIGAAWPWRGEGEVVAVVDSGCETGHPALAGADVDLTTRPGATPGDVTGHGTHLVATICGRGQDCDAHSSLAPAARVQAVGVHAGDEFAVPLGLSDFLASVREAGARIINLSWQSTRPVRDYDWKSEEIDRFTAKHPDTLVVVAAGNLSPIPLADDRWETTLTSPGTSRNALCVGAVGTGRAPAGTEFVAALSIASRTGIGPTFGGGVKPDLVAPGYFVRSARSSSAPDSGFVAVEGSMAWLGGTSQATAVVSACAALVREKLRKEYQLDPTAAAVKAALIAGTIRVVTSGPGTGAEVGYPDFVAGYGRLDLSRVMQGGLAIADDPTAPLQRKQGATARHLYAFKVDPEATWLTIVLCWFDAPRPRLTNDLKLQVKPVGHPRKIGNNEHAWHRGPGTMSNVDGNNNVEMTRWVAPPPGQYSLSVTAAFAETPQPYALAIACDGIDRDSLQRL